MIRLGLCCAFHQAPIRFRRATAKGIASRPIGERLRRISEICSENAASLGAAFDYCEDHSIGCFRINSEIFPLRTHPDVGYRLVELPDSEAVLGAFERWGQLARRRGLRTTFHPDQFIVLSSPRPEVVSSSITELEHQAEVARLVGADVINIHGGGGYGDKTAALERLVDVIRKLAPEVRERLTLENDDRIYTPAELLPVCEGAGVPFVYDVHHHRCLPDGLTEEEVTFRALETWNREPLFHLSSPREGYGGPNPRRHHDFVEIGALPDCWRDLEITVEVEAKAKEIAVERLARQLGESSG